ncbi:MAG: WcaF family extracellular polysaccharide biosynthesis acetyltransferase [Cyanobacteriota bacterium]|nr:WcaF family extracellular polysaccharide biosynthesis acetyltransferase [Cyanobacteriota bacterium]
MAPLSDLQRLERYALPAGFSPGRSRWLQLLWFCWGSPLLANRWLPGSLWRCWLLRLFGARIGNGCRLKPGLRVKYPWRLAVGPHCWLGEAVWIDNIAPVRLGRRVCLSQGVYLCTGNHDYRSPTFELRASSITVASEAWVAASAVLAPGCRIGRGAVVSLAAVVRGAVPAGLIVSGNPAQPVGSRQRSAAKRLQTSGSETVTASGDA